MVRPAKEGAIGGGNIFSIDTNGKNYKDLLDFYGANGAYPSGSLTLVGIRLYGMASQGGAFGNGCIFSTDTNGSRYEDLYDFNGMSYEPYGSLTIFGKMMYGMTNGGAFGGNIFSVDTAGNGYTVLAQFDNIDAGLPYGSLTLSQNGVLYGMTSGSEVPTHSDAGNIFSIDTDGSGYKYLGFTGRISGLHPYGSLTLSGSTLYGMTMGNIFSIDTDLNGYKSMFRFQNQGVNGSFPYGSLTISGSTLYGMTSAGGTNGYGVIFKIDTDAVAGINNLSAGKGAVKIYPNPSNGIFNLTLSNINEKYDIYIYNVLGQQVYQSNINSDNTEINLSTQPQGIYLYRVITEAGSLVGEGKVVVQH